MVTVAEPQLMFPAAVDVAPGDDREGSCVPTAVGRGVGPTGAAE